MMRVIAIPADQYNKMVRSYDQAIEKIKELEEKLNLSTKAVCANGRIN